MSNNIDSFIAEIKKRPCLYDKNHIHYSEALIRKQKWEEICGVLITDFKQLSQAEQNDACIEAQKKWHSLRACVSRDIRHQRRMKRNPGLKQKRKYIYFDKMSFILPYIDGKKDKKTSVPYDFEIGTNDPPKSPVVEETNLSDESKEIYFAEKTVQDIMKKCNFDEDTCFLLSMTKMFKSLNEAQKLDVRLEFLELLQNMRNDKKSRAIKICKDIEMRKALAKSKMNNYLRNNL